MDVPLYYITRDIERALGLPLSTPGYFVVSNKTTYASSIADGLPNVHLIKEDRLLDTHELLSHPTTKQFISHGSSALVFKPTGHIEKMCQESGWMLLNPPAELANTVEEKISQVTWLGELASFLPPHAVKQCKDILWQQTSFILQFNRAHTGSGTIYIRSEQQLKDIQAQFPNRQVRVTDYIDGPMFTSNTIVTPEKILIGNISYQITGLPPFTDEPFATIGNDWGLPKKILSEKQVDEYKKITTAIGEKLRASGWKGLFGTDIILEAKTGKLFLIEINARQPASTTYESQLQSAMRDQQGAKTMTTFEAHIGALLGKNLSDAELISIEDGAQIIQRVTKKISRLPTIRKEISGLKYILYENTKPNSEIVRFQTPSRIMKSHGELNELGVEIQRILL